MPDPNLGSRHRAAVGLSKECDAVVVVVSEETGALRIAERGKLYGPFSVEELSSELKARLSRARMANPQPAAANQATPQAEPESQTVELAHEHQLGDTMIEGVAAIDAEEAPKPQPAPKGRPRRAAG
jgi:hypothetical protein